MELGVNAGRAGKARAFVALDTFSSEQVNSPACGLYDACGRFTSSGRERGEAWRIATTPESQA